MYTNLFYGNKSKLKKVFTLFVIVSSTSTNIIQTKIFTDFLIHQLFYNGSFKDICFFLIEKFAYPSL